MLLLLALACAPPVTDTAPDYAPAVVVVVTDTVRADLAGADRPAWLEGGREYTRAYSAAPWTSSSTVTLVTGRNPRPGPEQTHPAGGAPDCDLQRPGLPVLRQWPEDAWPSLVLSDHPVLATARGVERETGWTGPGDTALVTMALDALHDPETGPALYVHTLGAHDPYDGFTDGVAALSSAQKVNLKRRWCGSMDETTAAWARTTYRGAVTRALDAIAPLIQAARATGALVIWTADHGEALGEDDRWGHATDLHDAQIRVPLVVWGPGVEAGTDDQIIPGTCVGQTARLVLGEVGELCDLRTGDIRGEAVAGILDEAGVWQERVVR